MKLILGVLIILLPMSIFAHQTSNSYLRIEKSQMSYNAQLYVALNDLDGAIGIDLNHNGGINELEVKQRKRVINQYILSKLSINQNNTFCSLQINAHQIQKFNFGVYLSAPLIINCENRDDNLQISYRLFQDIFPSHQGIITYISPNNEFTKIVDRNNSYFETISNHGQQNWIVSSIEFIKQGIWHIWIGVDHILFLIALLFPVFIWREQSEVRGFKNLKPIVLDLFKIVTSFSIAHSITLSITTLGWISLPVKWVETAIALTVVIAGINLLYPIWKKRSWFVVFLFGLIHGFGFANVLMDLLLPIKTLSISLISFNIGVELGQIGIILALFPFLYLSRNTFFYQRYLVPVGAFSIVSVGLVWSVTRGFSII